MQLWVQIAHAQINEKQNLHRYVVIGDGVFLHKFQMFDMVVVLLLLLRMFNLPVSFPI